MTASGAFVAKLLEHDRRDPVACWWRVAERRDPKPCPPAMYACHGDVVTLRPGEGPSQALALRFNAVCGPVARGVRHATLQRDGVRLAVASGYRDARKIPLDAVLIVPSDFACP